MEFTEEEKSILISGLKALICDYCKSEEEEKLKSKGDK